jgi:hypothetical protein
MDFEEGGSRIKSNDQQDFNILRHTLFDWKRDCGTGRISEGYSWARRLAAYVRSVDPTRP